MSEGVLNFSMTMARGDGDRDYVEVTLGEVKVTIYEALTYPGKVIIEIDRDHIGDSIGVRIDDRPVYDD